MSTARATLVYGLTIRSASLFFAADAWTRLSPSLPFFDLIFLRRRKGGLVSRGGGGYSAVTKVPNEVWEEVRHWLVQEEVASSEDTHLRHIHCEDPACSLCPAVGCEIYWKDIKGRQLCDWAMEDVREFLFDCVGNWSVESISKMEQLVSGFGLSLPSTSPITTQSDVWSDENALALISAPSTLERGTNSTPLVNAVSRAWNGPDEHTLVGVSFQLPRNIDQRFTRFIRLFNFEIVDSSINKIVSKSVKSVNVIRDEESSKDETSGVRNEETAEIKPSWRLYLTCKTG